MNNKVDGIREAVILAAGEKEFDKPACALEVEDITLIERAISILKENGIEKIVIVTGYNSSFLEELVKKESSVVLVNNEKYKWTGNMTSLALAKEFITDDFILIEGDLIFESQAISQIVNSKEKDCILITNESGSGDEGFVQLKNGYLFKLSKDIHQFNRIDGEMIGISRISYSLYSKMLKEFENNINPYLHYEYMLLDLSREHRVAALKIDDLAWGEIDTLKQYDAIKNYLFSKIKRKDLKFEKDNIKSIIQRYLDIPAENVTTVIHAGGMTNKNYKVCINGEYFILRVPGAGTENMISRKNEMVNSKLASDLGLNVDIPCFDEERGIKISKFIEEAETLTGRAAKKEENMKLVTDILRTLHNSKIEMLNTFDVFSEMEKYEDLVKACKGSFYKDYSEVKNRVMRLKDIFKECDFNLVPSHNDTVPENFVKDKDGRLYLIDWEYSGLNDEMWDLAAHSIECKFSESDEELFLKLYFNGEASKNNRIKLLINKICQDFLWAVWTLIKEAKGDDFGTYGIDRYNRAKENLDKLEKLI